MLKSELSCLSLLNKISIASDADFLIVRLAEEEGSELSPRNFPIIKLLSGVETPMVTLWLHDNVLAMSLLVLFSRSNYISVS